MCVESRSCGHSIWETDREKIYWRNITFSSDSLRCSGLDIIGVSSLHKIPLLFISKVRLMCEYFYRAASFAGRSEPWAKCPSVRPSVCLSNAWIVKNNERNVCQHFIPYKRSVHLVFWQEEWLWGTSRVQSTPSTWNFESDIRYRNADFLSISIIRS